MKFDRVTIAVHLSFILLAETINRHSQSAKLHCEATNKTKKKKKRKEKQHRPSTLPTIYRYVGTGHINTHKETNAPTHEHHKLSLSLSLSLTHTRTQTCVWVCMHAHTLHKHIHTHTHVHVKLACTPTKKQTPHTSNSMRILYCTSPMHEKAQSREMTVAMEHS